MACPSCGASLIPGDRFCRTCGQPTLPPATTQPAFITREPVAPAQPVVVPNLTRSTWVVLGVAVAAVLVPVVTWAMSRDGDQTAPPDTAELVDAEQEAPEAAGPTAPFECRNADAAFTISVPQSWADGTPDNESCTRFDAPSQDPDRSVAVVVLPDGGPFRTAQPLGDVSKRRRGYVGGRPADYYEATFESGGSNYSTRTYILDRAGTAFSVVLMEVEGTPAAQKTRDQFPAVVASVEFD